MEHSDTIKAVYSLLQMRAGVEVQKAINNGSLRPAQTYSCVDCGNSATSYDHRDYFEPLTVAPVCTSCNMRRGQAAATMTKLHDMKDPAAMLPDDWNQTKNITIRMPVELMARLIERAEAEHRSVTQQIIVYIERALDAEAVIEMFSQEERKGKRNY